MTYIPTTNINTPVIPTAHTDGLGKDFVLHCGLIREKWRRFYPKVIYYQKDILPTTSTSTSQMSGAVPHTVVDPLWGEAVPGAAGVSGWKQPHTTSGWNAADTRKWVSPVITSESQGSTPHVAGPTISGTLLRKPVVGGTITLTIADTVPYVLQDVADTSTYYIVPRTGHFTKTSGGSLTIVSSSINYNTCVWTITFSGNLPIDKAITVTYTYGTFMRVLEHEQENTLYKHGSELQREMTVAFAAPILDDAVITIQDGDRFQ